MVESVISSILSHVSDTWLNLLIDGVSSCFVQVAAKDMSLQLNDEHG